MIQIKLYLAEQITCGSLFAWIKMVINETPWLKNLEIREVSINGFRKFIRSENVDLQ